MRRWTRLSVLVLFFLLIWGWFGGVVDARFKLLVPDFTLESITGEQISLADYRGKVVVLNFWASWCPACRQEMVDFQKLHYELAESSEAVLLMLAQIDGVRETRQSARQYLDKNDFHFNVLYDHGTVGYSIFGVPGLPTTVIIDSEGYLYDAVLGAVTYDQVWQMIKEAAE
ncbi:MAG: TlpA family protein disulfide reductase [Firmicutes bacterium]|nr:TlpA family protein disulfide reductase [Bacillota bacterium]